MTSSYGAGLCPDTSLPDDGHGRLRIQRRVLGLPLTVTAQLRLSGRTVSAVPVAASVAALPVDLAGPRVNDAFTGQRRTLPKLPAGLEPTDVSVTPAGVVLPAHGNDIRPSRRRPDDAQIDVMRRSGRSGCAVT
ncbi:hypothetical protein [Streptomyces sp. LUP30]|uniref:hypothetical protein n=1 Tax=Streptomyces sp. LUP30 TaxID=1890285 RepID=UPI0008515F76|nr:hypothetical protein [Streptomyces sp. LUP30]